ncbi:MAG TPA: hypothetical protein VE422_11800 [Terriglobia bacterium]|nr:hypothetical protein [Terriglobia bacterium]
MPERHDEGNGNRFTGEDVPKTDVRRFFDFNRGLLGIGVGGPLADLHAFISTTLTDGFTKGLGKLEPEVSSVPAIDAVEQIAANLSRAVLGFEGDVLRKSLQEALLDAAGPGYDPEGPSLESELSRFLQTKGKKGFLELFLARYVFNTVWIRIHDAVQTQIPDERLFATTMYEVESLCRSLVKSVLDEWETEGKLDQLERDSHIAESLIRRLEDSLLEFSSANKGQPDGRQLLPSGPTRTIAATVVQYSSNRERAAGLRGSSAPGQQILFQAEDLVISLKIFVSGEDRSILGQLLHPSVQSWVPRPNVRLIPPAGEILSTTTDELGEFRFRDVPGGPSQLEVDIPPNLRILGDFVVGN